MRRGLRIERGFGQQETHEEGERRIGFLSDHLRRADLPIAQFLPGQAQRAIFLVVPQLAQAFGSAAERSPASEANACLRPMRVPNFGTAARF